MEKYVFLSFNLQKKNDNLNNFISKMPRFLQPIIAKKIIFKIVLFTSLSTKTVIFTTWLSWVEKKSFLARSLPPSLVPPPSLATDWPRGATDWARVLPGFYFCNNSTSLRVPVYRTHSCGSFSFPFFTLLYLFSTELSTN